MVSILAHPERWALLSTIIHRWAPEIVSILAHPERWALRVTDCRTRPSFILFQSSPTPKGGRYFPRPALETQRQVFQSSPTPKGGRYKIGKRKPGSTLSFNPRPPRKVGATHRMRSLGAVHQGFNPRPPRKVGATHTHAQTGVPLCVSILAHPERWALPALGRSDRVRI